MEKRSTQSRGGVKGESPLRGQGAELPCGVWGNAPTVPRATSMSNALNKGAGSEASLPVTSRQMGATDQQGKRFGFLLLVFFVAGVSPPRRRVGGFAVAPDTPSQRTSMLLDFLCCRGISRLRARVGGFAVAPDTPSQRTSMLLDFSCCKGELHLSPSFSGKKFPKCAFPPCAKRKSMLQYARIEAFERAEAFAPVRENVFVDNPDEELRKEDFSYAVRLL